MQIVVVMATRWAGDHTASLGELTAGKMERRRATLPNGERPRVVWFPSREVCCTEFARSVKCDWADLASSTEEGD